MEITRQADYAVRAVLEVALAKPDERVRSEEIAGGQQIPPAVLIRVLGRLAAEGIVDTQRGVGGGVRLARSRANITLLDVVEAVDGPITLNRCMRSPGECPMDGTCAVHPLWVEIRNALRDRLAGITFEMLANGAQNGTGG